MSGPTLRSRREKGAMPGNQSWVTREGERVAWTDLSDRHLLNIVRMLTRAVRSKRRVLSMPHDALNTYVFKCVSEIQGEEYALDLLRDGGVWARRQWRRTCRKDLRSLQPKLLRAIDEADARGLLPTSDDLRIAWDRACASGAINDPDNPPVWCFVELWVGYRGESTLSPEFKTALVKQAVSA